LLASNGALSPDFLLDLILKSCTDKRLIETVHRLVARIIFSADSNDALGFAGQKSADKEYREEIVDRRLSTGRSVNL
jgi:hypothetical protein